jgi:iron-sulfur cluster repair protein YtfE (RIC family)
MSLHQVTADHRSYHRSMTGENTARIAFRATPAHERNEMSSHPAAANRIVEADAVTHTGHGRLRRISDALGSDHDRLARLEVAAFVARAAGEAKTAEEWYAAFCSALKHHIAVEEEFLFPVFEKRLGLSPAAGPTDVLRREHSEILQLVGEILRTIGDPAKLPDEARAVFHEVLEKHHLKEEEVLYPALDYALSPGESDALIEKIQEFST